MDRKVIFEPGDSVITAELVRELRVAASQGASVRILAELIQDRVGCRDNPVIAVLAGFTHAFHLPLQKVLPIREWLGSNEDQEIDALILPEIEKARQKWSQVVVEVAGGGS